MAAEQDVPRLPVATPESPIGPPTLDANDPRLVGRSSGDLDFELAPESQVPTIEWPPGRSRGETAGAREFGKYELLGEIGRGGMGVVYKARQRDLDRMVAIKMILANHLASADQVRRFYAEAQAAAKVSDPHIVAIHDFGQIHGQHYFAMEYIAGPSLAQLLKDGTPVDIETSARWVAAVAGAVANLHAIGVVHRDLKPSNILLDESGRPRISDFGLAKMLDVDGSVTGVGAIVGTPNYMAPEQAAGRGAAVGPLSDIYSLGAILYELLTNRPPFDGETPLDTLVQVIEGEPIQPSRLNPKIPGALESICLKCLEKEPAARYPTAEALAEDLRRYLQGEAIEARPPGLLHGLRRWARREPALASRLGTMAVCGAIIQANYYLIGGQDPDSLRKMIAVVVCWALFSIACQARLSQGHWLLTARYAWAGRRTWRFSRFWCRSTRDSRRLRSPATSSWWSPRDCGSGRQWSGSRPAWRSRPTACSC